MSRMSRFDVAIAEYDRNAEDAAASPEEPAYLIRAVANLAAAVTALAEEVFLRRCQEVTEEYLEEQ